jgi:Tfp pilus assembly protein FimV
MTFHEPFAKHFATGLPVNRFRGRTHEIARPDRAQEEYRDATPSRLAELQAAWDEADEEFVAMRDRVDAARKAHEAEEATEAAARAKVDEANRQRQRAETLALLKARYLGVPGIGEADWAKEDHDALLREYARQQALAHAGSAAIEPRSLVDVRALAG